ncbi:hypothetical protein SCLCIDRAFT_849475 [Scleroderma citrinum Foug A]|uniref:Uncharacterized protein n=1 Tax=Scleroderma citrinum Foug A TaxID=1036808 RepID=A0A0C3E284_9AGAM|nr:hypothetical protein SCLCIDRAFT_849475 [Scleroderma citrinum Foug A]
MHSAGNDVDVPLLASRDGSQAWRTTPEITRTHCLCAQMHIALTMSQTPTGKHQDTPSPKRAFETWPNTHLLALRNVA